jgi:hypothetical protein
MLTSLFDLGTPHAQNQEALPWMPSRQLRFTQEDIHSRVRAMHLTCATHRQCWVPSTSSVECDGHRMG